MTDLLLTLAGWLKPYITQSSMAIIATVLVIYGSSINNAIKRLIAPLHFSLRTLAFIFVCAFGYGLATVWLTPVLAGQLAKIPELYLAPSVFGVFVLLGIAAQREGQI